MFERLVPAPPTLLPGDLPEGDSLGHLNESEGAPVAEEEGNRSLSVPPTSQANAPPSTGDDMEVDDEPQSASAGPSSMLETRPKRPTTKRNFADLGKERSLEDVQQRGPSKTKRTKIGNSQVSGTTISTGVLQRQVHQHRSVPIVTGTKYMHIDIIDLSTIEVNCPICLNFTN